MSKSLNNYIGVLEDDDTMWKKLKPAFTVESRKRLSDPGNPSICNIFTMHTSFSKKEECEEINRDCRAAKIGCVDCKKILLKNMAGHFAPIREKAIELESKHDYINDIINDGAKKCKKIAAEVMQEVHTKLGILR